MADEQIAQAQADAHTVTEVETPAPQDDAEITPHADSPVVFLGRTFNTNIYTFVFGLLAVTTLAEVIVSSILPQGLVRIGLLVAGSITKALLVMAFYMHLREDNKIFAAAIALPFIIVAVVVMFLLAVPQVAYPY